MVEFDCGNARQPLDYSALSVPSMICSSATNVGGHCLLRLPTADRRAFRVRGGLERRSDDYRTASDTDHLRIIRERRRDRPDTFRHSALQRNGGD